jgi:hypothetical protein
VGTDWGAGELGKTEPWGLGSNERNVGVDSGSENSFGVWYTGCERLEREDRAMRRVGDFGRESKTELLALGFANE